MTAAWNDDWECLKRFLPTGWENAAWSLGAWQRTPRSIDSTETLLRLLLIHLADGCSMREVSVRARESGLACISDVALLKRLRASSDWLRWLASQMLIRHGPSYSPPAWLSSYKVRTVDATVVCEPGSTGTDWRIHYSFGLFGLQCDEFHLTGPRIGESFCRFQIAPGDLMMGDRAYGHYKGFRYVLDSQGHFICRLKNKAFALVDHLGKERSLSELLDVLKIGQMGHWQLSARIKAHADLPIRLCALRMSEEAAEKAVRRAAKDGRKKQRTPNADTLALHRYVVLATSLPESITAEQVLELYRARWQIELAFKRLKSILGLGHLPKGEEESAKAWLHGKLFVAFLAQSLIEEGRAISPWGYPIG